MYDIDIKLKGNKLVITSDPVILANIYDLLVQSIKDSKK